MRLLMAVFVLALALASAAQGKLIPTFSQRVVEPNNTVELDLGEGAETFAPPLRIYLVPLDAANSTQGEDDSRLVKIGELGRPGQFGTPRTLRFVVPDLPSGGYTAEVWFKGYASGTWANALEGIHPVLSIRNPDKAEKGGAAVRSPRSSAEEGFGRFWLVAAILPGLLGMGLLTWMLQHARRAAPGA